MQNFFGANKVHCGKFGSGVYYIFLKKLVAFVFMTMHDSHNVCLPFFMRFFPKRGQFGPYYTT